MYWQKIRKHFTRAMLFSFAGGAIAIALPETGWLNQTVARWVTVLGGLAFVIGLVLTLRNEGKLKADSISLKWEHYKIFEGLMLSLINADKEQRADAFPKIERELTGIGDNEMTRFIHKFFDVLDWEDKYNVRTIRKRNQFHTRTHKGNNESQIQKVNGKWELSANIAVQTA